jgi:cell division protein ZapA
MKAVFQPEGPTMSQTEDQVTISIGSKSYHINCHAEQIASLKESADYLNQQLRDISQQGHALNTERSAMMAALNIAYELITARQQQSLYIDTMSQKIQELQHKIESALATEE